MTKKTSDTKTSDTNTRFKLVLSGNTGWKICIENNFCVIKSELYAKLIVREDGLYGKSIDDEEYISIMYDEQKRKKHFRQDILNLSMLYVPNIDEYAKTWYLSRDMVITDIILYGRSFLKITNRRLAENLNIELNNMTSLILDKCKNVKNIKCDCKHMNLFNVENMEIDTLTLHSISSTCNLISTKITMLDIHLKHTSSIIMENVIIKNDVYLELNDITLCKVIDCKINFLTVVKSFMSKFENTNSTINIMNIKNKDVKTTLIQQQC